MAQAPALALVPALAMVATRVARPMAQATLAQALEDSRAARATALEQAPALTLAMAATRAASLMAPATLAQALEDSRVANLMAPALALDTEATREANPMGLVSTLAQELEVVAPTLRARQALALAVMACQEVMEVQSLWFQ